MGLTDLTGRAANDGAGKKKKSSKAPGSNPLAGLPPGLAGRLSATTVIQVGGPNGNVVTPPSKPRKTAQSRR